MPDPTRVEGADDSAEGDKSATAPAPVRWSGAAAVPEGGKKKRRILNDDEDDDWGTMPAVDPWADQDTPWALIPPPAPAPVDLPPTRIDGPGSPPPTRIDGPAHPPTRIETAAPGPAVPSPPAAAVPTPRQAVREAAAPRAPVPVPEKPEAAPAAPPVVKRGGWGRRKPAPQPAAQPAPSPLPVPPAPSRLPVQPRPQPYLPPPSPQPAGTRPPNAQPPNARPPRRKRKWPRNLLLLTVLGAVLCCGVPGYFAWPAAQQYPVSAALPGQFRDLSLRDDSASRKAVDKLTQQLSDNGLTGQAFAGIYADGNGKRVTVFGTTGWRTNPQQDVKAEVDRLTTDYRITDVASYDLGQTGAHERCGVGRTNGAGVVVCVWADHGSLATVLLTRRNVTESAELVGVLRTAVLTKG